MLYRSCRYLPTYVLVKNVPIPVGERDHGWHPGDAGGQQVRRGIRQEGGQQKDRRGSTGN